MPRRVKEAPITRGSSVKKSAKKSANRAVKVSPASAKEFSELQLGVGRDAGEMARTIVIQQCEEAGLTVPKVLAGIVAGMDAKEQKVNFSQVEDDFRYSKAMIAWSVRQKAIDQAIAILGIKAPERSDVGFVGAGAVILSVDFGDEEQEN